MRRLALTAAVLAASMAVHTPVRAQSLTLSLFERYLDSLREHAGIPSMTALVSQDGVIVWERAFGRHNLETSSATTFETTYSIGGLSQAISSTLLLRKCVDQSYAELTDRVVRWSSDYLEPEATLQSLLTHTSPSGAFRYSPARYAALTAVVEQCASSSYGQVAADEIFDRFGMASTVPGNALIAPTAGDQSLFDAATLDRYADAIRRMAVPYRIDSRGRATRTDLTTVRADAATGIVSTARDLFRFDAALGGDALLDPATRLNAWTRQRSTTTLLPTGLGWFVQNYEGQLIVWQFGVIPNGYSSLMIKAPNRGITLILLANSDGLSAPFSLDSGDVTTSLFAQLFLKLLVL